VPANRSPSRQAAHHCIDRYHRANEGKWDGMMLQTHIGYTS
jgi:hypothetical protein